MHLDVRLLILFGALPQAHSTPRMLVKQRDLQVTIMIWDVEADIVDHKIIVVAVIISWRYFAAPTLHRLASPTHCLASHRNALYRIGLYRTASHRTTSHRIESHRTAPNRKASQHRALHRTSPRRTATHHIAFHRTTLHGIASYRTEPQQITLSLVIEHTESLRHKERPRKPIP